MLEIATEIVLVKLRAEDEVRRRGQHGADLQSEVPGQAEQVLRKFEGVQCKIGCE